MTPVSKATLLMLALTLLTGPQAALADGLEEFELQAEMDYIVARQTLTDKGWRPTQEAGSEIIDEALPEISCGSGYDTICSVAYQRGSDLLALVVAKRNGQWVIIGEY